MTESDQAAGQFEASPEFLPNRRPENSASSLVLKHPGVAAVNAFLSKPNDVTGGLKLLLAAMAPEVREEDFLRRLDPYFLRSLQVAVQRLVGLRSVSNQSRS